MATTSKTTTLLKGVLADTYTLYLKTQNYHWNVTGIDFRQLHLLFEDQYTELAAAIDTLAERIRARGDIAPGSFKQFLELSSIKEAKEKADAKAMVKDLLDSHRTLSKRLHAVLKAAQKEGDEVTVGVMSTRMESHEKQAWMLQSTIS